MGGELQMDNYEYLTISKFADQLVELRENITKFGWELVNMTEVPTKRKVGTRVIYRYRAFVRIDDIRDENLITLTYRMDKNDPYYFEKKRLWDQYYDVHESVKPIELKSKGGFGMLMAFGLLTLLFTAMIVAFACTGVTELLLPIGIFDGVFAILFLIGLISYTNAVKANEVIKCEYEDYIEKTKLEKRNIVEQAIALSKR